MKFSISKAFKAAFKVCRQNFFVVFSLSVVSAIPSTILFLHVAPSMMPSLMVHVLYGIAMPSLLIWKCVGLVGLEIVCSLVTFFMISALFGAFGESGVKFRNYFPNFKKILNYFLAMILLLLVGGLIGGVTGWVIIDKFDMFNSTSVLVNILAGLLSFAAVALIVVISLRYGIFYIQEVLSGNSVLQSFKNNAKLTSGNFWKLLLLQLLLALIGFLFCFLWGFLIGGIGGIFSAVSGVNGLALPFKILIFIGEMSFIVPFSSLTLIHVYNQLSSPKPNSKEALPEI
jgi:hypothetical protein